MAAHYSPNPKSKEMGVDLPGNQTRYGSNKGRVVSMAVIAGIGLALMLAAPSSILVVQEAEAEPSCKNCKKIERIEKKIDRLTEKRDKLIDEVIKFGPMKEGPNGGAPDPTDNNNSDEDGDRSANNLGDWNLPNGHYA